MDYEAVLADAPLKPDLKPQLKNCVRLDIWQASIEQLQAELLRLDAVLLRQRTAHTKAEVITHKNRNVT